MKRLLFIAAAALMELSFVTNAFAQEDEIIVTASRAGAQP